MIRETGTWAGELLGVGDDLTGEVAGDHHGAGVRLGDPVGMVIMAGDHHGEAIMVVIGMDLIPIIITVDQMVI